MTRRKKLQNTNTQSSTGSNTGSFDFDSFNEEIRYRLSRKYNIPPEFIRIDTEENIDEPKPFDNDNSNSDINDIVVEILTNCPSDIFKAFIDVNLKYIIEEDHNKYLLSLLSRLEDSPNEIFLLHKLAELKKTERV